MLFEFDNLINSDADIDKYLLVARHYTHTRWGGLFSS